MTIHQANEILKTIKFLHYKFLFVSTHMDAVELQIRATMPDSRNRSIPIEIMHNNTIDLTMCDAEMVVSYVWACVQSALVHEAAELFLVNGQDPYNQHYGSGESRQKLNLIKSMFTCEQTDRIT